MGKFDPVIEQYKAKGIREDNIEYAINSIKDGAARDSILENLTADYRGMTHDGANEMLDALYKAYGGEFKYSSQAGYLVGSLALLLGSLKIWRQIGDRSFKQISKDPWDLLITGGIVLLIAGYFYFKAFRGTYRETPETDRLH